jgi:peroxiredoxin
VLAWLVSASVQAHGDEKSADLPLATVPQFSLDDAAGANHTRGEWREAKAVVLIFLGAECPVSNGYSPKFRELATRYHERGVVTLGVYCDPTMTPEAAAAHAKEYGLTFATLLDPEQMLARGCGVRITPEVVVALATGEVVYRGRVDNRYSLDGKRRDEANVFDLEAAIEATLAGKRPTVRETKAFGCPLPALRAK